MPYPFSMQDKFHYGGQAVIEGVMLRGKRACVTALRRPAGDITVLAEPLGGLYISPLRKIPLLRGNLVLLEAMTLGIKTLLFSASVSLEEEDKKEASGGLVWGLFALSLAFVAGLFFVTPLLLTRLVNRYFTLSPVIFHLTEGIIRLAIFIVYLVLVSLLGDIKRIFAYHGAEHKVVNAYEGGTTDGIDAVRNYSRIHLRCGTSFLFAVMVLAILIFSFVPRTSLYVMLLSRVLLIPVIAALSYEVTYFSSQHPENPVVKAILLPGLLLQRLTTREPDDAQLEVALTAMKKVVEMDSPSPVPDSVSSQASA
ncbi:MAG: DUF1385 domain-containing protein [Chloroflexota bacterium]